MTSITTDPSYSGFDLEEDKTGLFEEIERLKNGITTPKGKYFADLTTPNPVEGIETSEAWKILFDTSDVVPEDKLVNAVETILDHFTLKHWAWHRPLQRATTLEGVQPYLTHSNPKVARVAQVLEIKFKRETNGN